MLEIPATVFLELFGPFDKLICHLILGLKTSIIIHLLCMVIFIVLVKYLYTFVFRNPLALLSEFWCNFININTVLATTLTQTVFILLPGKNAIGIGGI